MPHLAMFWKPLSRSQPTHRHAGGVLTGRGADRIVIDEPLKPEEALSDARRRAANEWYDHTLSSRHHDQVDSTAQFLDWFKASGREDGIYAYYRLRAEELRRRQDPAPARSGRSLRRLRGY
jgi:hypothetical protein